ncbi:MAG: 23S rRNA (guanosine(2251)-2'-O)-methyltransferase RlmB [Aquisalinus sp.]|nr:23S rRNA (guanosine(2251)-2'-O)-methyltransferase RlmB [Aquisalinus sp.]
MDKKQVYPNARARKAEDPDRPVWLYGRHAVAAALTNPDRRIERLVATRNAAIWLKEQGVEATPDDLKPDAIDGMLPPGSVHQGLAAYAHPLPRHRLKEACQPAGHELRPVLVLDQITDPQNIGAIFRSAAAFGVRAIIAQERRTPVLAGALAKAAAGAIETVPLVQVVNIARSLEALKELGYACIGLAGEAESPLSQVQAEKPVALVLGAEGAGLRQLVGETCDQLACIPMAPAMESLNVSNAAAISLYELTRGQDFLSGK